jgi:ATP synthase protein I
MDKRPEDKKKDTLWLAQISSVGITLVLCTLFGFGIGYFIDSKLHTSPIFALIFLIVGIAAGFVNVFRTLAQGDRKSGPGNNNRPS